MEKSNNSDNIETKSDNDLHGRRKFKCNQCEKVYDKKGILKNHIKQKHQEFICEICNEKLTSSFLLEKHCKVEHFGESNLLECEICFKKFTLKHELYQHKKNSHGEKKIKCKFEDCTKLFRTLATMNEHHKLVHLKNRKDVVRECDICGFTSKQKRHFKNHMIGKHLGFQCEFCDRSFGSHKIFQKHFFEDHSMGEKVECDVCQKKFSYKISLNQHKKYFHSEKKFKCEYFKCDKMFIQLSRMRQHFRKDHLKIKPENKFECDICGYKTHTLYNLRIHMNKHRIVREKPSKYLQCKNCDYKTSHLKCLRQHMRKMLSSTTLNEKGFTRIFRLCHENGIKNCYIKLQKLDVLKISKMQCNN